MFHQHLKQRSLKKSWNDLTNSHLQKSQNTLKNICWKYLYKDFLNRCSGIYFLGLLWGGSSTNYFQKLVLGISQEKSKIPSKGDVQPKNMKQKSHNIGKHPLFKTFLCQISRTYLDLIKKMNYVSSTFAPNIPEEILEGSHKFFEKRLWRESIYQKSLKRNHYQTKFAEKSAPRISEEQFCTK